MPNTTASTPAGDARQNRARADDDTLHNAHDTVFEREFFILLPFYVRDRRKAAERDAV